MDVNFSMENNVRIDTQQAPHGIHFPNNGLALAAVGAEAERVGACSWKGKS